MKLINKRISMLIALYLENKTRIFFSLLLIAFIFLRFYELSERAFVGWDQADSAWAAKNIIYDNHFRLEGVPIKGNASMFMGSLYYYLITPFYFFSNLDMIASPIFASVVSIISFLIFYQITKKIFDTKVALVASFFYAFSIGIIGADRVQAAFVLIPIFSYAVFYFLYKFITGNEKHVLYLAAVIGFGFHIHFTTILYIPIVLLTLPFFPRTKKALLFGFLSLLIFLLFVSPMLYTVFFARHSGSNSIITYLHASYHGLHLKRVLQLSHDAFISFETVLPSKVLRPLVFLVLPIFAYIFYTTQSKKRKKEALLITYLISLWILIPWLILATYNGELTDYYFSLPRNLAITMAAFIIVYLLRIKFLPLKVLIIFLLTFYAGHNLYLFINVPPGNYLQIKQSAEYSIRMNEKMRFKDRDPLFYTYYIYSRYKK